MLMVQHGMLINFTKSENIVTEQADDQIIFWTTPSWFGGNAAIEGEPWGIGRN